MIYHSGAYYMFASHLSGLATNPARILRCKAKVRMLLHCEMKFIVVRVHMHMQQRCGIRMHMRMHMQHRTINQLFNASALSPVE